MNAHVDSTQAESARADGPAKLREQHGPWFGGYGGVFMPEPLMAAIDELARVLRGVQGRPGVPGRVRSPLPRLHRQALDAHRGDPAERAGGRAILLKREDLNHTGSHKINNVLGQALCAQRLGKTRRHRRDGRRAARRRHGDGGRALRHGVRRLHGRGRTPRARHSTSRGCACWVPRSCRSRAAPARSRTPSTRGCATGSRTSTRPTT